MPAISTPDPAAPDTLAAEQLYQDSIIAKRLPAWLRSANGERLAAIGKAMGQSLVVRQQLAKALSRIQGIDDFARSELQQAMTQRLGTECNVEHWRFVVGHREPVINQQPVGVHLTEVVYQQTPLIEAALRNFTDAQTKAGGQPRGNRLIGPSAATSATTTMPPSAIEFARLCRDLDIGQRYQRHLHSVLLHNAASTAPVDHAPADNSPGENVSALLANAHRYTLLVDAYEARLKGVLSESELQLVVGLASSDTLGRLNGDPVVAKQLRLLGCTLEQIVVLDVIDEGLLRNTTRRVLVHIPGDPNGAWSTFKSPRYLANELGRRLRGKPYQAFFSRFIRRRDSQRFFSVVIPAYADLAIWANISLDEHMSAYPTGLFQALATARIGQIKDDAAMIAMPVAALDREVQRQHDERLAAEGWALISLAGLFVPVIGAGLLAMAAWQLLGEVYHGVQAWHDGDTSEALDHLFNVAADLALMGATAAGVTVASRIWARSAVVDGLVPVTLEDGTGKLWNQDLQPFRSEAPAADATQDELGVQRLAGQSWIEMDGHHYPVTQRTTDGQWQLQSRAGHGPLLCHNNAGAWRLWSEQPMQWNDVHRMFRRFGGQLRELDDEQIDDVLSIHDLSANHLRAMHVHQVAPDAVLLESVSRVRLEQRIRGVIRRLRSGEQVDDPALLQKIQALLGAPALSSDLLAQRISIQRRQLFERVHESTQSSDGPGVGVLRRLFPSLHGRAANALVRSASLADRQRLLSTGQVPLRLAEAARAVALRVRTVRVYEALRVDTSQDADLARVALGMLKHLPGAATLPSWRLFEGSANGPQLLSTGEGTQLFDLVHQNGAFQLLGADGSAIGDPGELFEVMAAAYDDTQRAAIGVGDPFAHNLRVLLGRQAVQRRLEVETLLSGRTSSGWFNPPVRQADGRIGYPLSGRGLRGSSRRRRPVALFAMVRALFPSYRDAQILAWISDLHDSGLPIEAELTRLGEELNSLREHLHAWLRQARNPREEDDRNYFRNALINCWQRSANVGPDINELAVNYRFTLYGVSTRTLPDLPDGVSFSHVFELALLGMELQTLPEGFLRGFTNLRILELSGNQLIQVPQSLMQMPYLRELDLYNNRIVLDATQATILGSCESLEYINLSFNPLGRTFSLGGLSRLRRLHLRHTGINELPHALFECPDLLLADLRENQLTELSEAFYQSPPWIRRIILLADNPLTAEQTERLTGAVQGVDWGLGQVVSAERAGAIRQRWLDATRSLTRDAMSMAWEALEREPGAGDFFDVLRRLLETADFQQNGEALADRVFVMIRAMNERVSLRDELLSQASQNLTCQDSVALCFSNLELRMLVWQAQYKSDNAQDALLRLGRQLWRLDEVDRIALADIRARRALGADPDEIEVGLAYRLALRDVLDLPAQPNDMLFAEVAGVDTQTIALAQARVQAAETPQQVAQSLVDRDFWREHLLRVQSEHFEAIDAPFHDRLEQLMEAETVPEGERLAQMNRIHDERLRAQRASMLELTLAALKGTPPSSSTSTPTS